MTRVRDYTAEYRTRRYGATTCESCGAAFVRRRRTQRFCGPDCVRWAAPMRARLLAILADGAIHTAHEIATALYGSDDYTDRHAVYEVVYRLRRDGHQIDSDRTGWRGGARYRLVAEAQEGAA